MDNIEISDEKRCELILKFDEYTKCLLNSYAENRGIFEHLEDTRGINSTTACFKRIGGSWFVRVEETQKWMAS